MGKKETVTGKTEGVPSGMAADDSGLSEDATRLLKLADSLPPGSVWLDEIDLDALAGDGRGIAAAWELVRAGRGSAVARVFSAGREWDEPADGFDFDRETVPDPDTGGETADFDVWLLFLVG